MDTEWDKKVFNDNWSVKVAKEKDNFLAEQAPEERGRKGSRRRKPIHFPRRERSKLSGGKRL